MIKAITLIGSGNVASNLGRALQLGGVTINDIYSLHFERADALARTLKTTAKKRIQDVSPTSDLVILAVNDDNIVNVATAFPYKSIPVVHTSGTQEMEVFKNCGFNQFGVFYPLQSISANNYIAFDDVPICVESNQQELYTALYELGKKISNEVIEIDSEKRKILHLAAVFANNFSNHLYAIAGEILDENNLPFDLLKPLILRTADKIQTASPVSQQTGPAVRDDTETIEKHLSLLKNENHRTLYKLFNKSILQMKKD